MSNKIYIVSDNIPIRLTKFERNFTKHTFCFVTQIISKRNFCFETEGVYLSSCKSQSEEYDQSVKK